MAVRKRPVEGLEQMTNFWRDRRVFVTGGTGMIGSWLVNHLVGKGAHVVALIHDADPQSELYRSRIIERITVVNGKLEDFWTLERAINQHDVDTVFHLGAQTLVGTAHRSPLPTLEANVRGTYNLLEVCRLRRDLVQRVVLASSDKAYGESSRLPYTEDMPLTGQHPYEVSKSCADLIGQVYAHTYDLPAAIVRCGNVYGGGDLNWSRIVPGTIRSCLHGQRPIIRSDGKFVRDYIYVKDVAGAYLRVAESLPEKRILGHAFNISTEAPIAVLDLVRVIQKFLECETLEPDIQNFTRGEIRDQHLSAAKARDLLKWEPQFNLESGLQETIAWYRNYFAADIKDRR